MRPRGNPNQIEYYESVYEMKDLLREIHKAWQEGVKGRANVVSSRRAIGKTEALLQFVGERTLAMPSFKDRIGIVCPNDDIAYRFQGLWLAAFPLLRCPLIVPVGSQPEPDRYLRGENLKELYAEECFLIPRRAMALLSQVYPLVAGVATIETPTAIRVNW